jgi:hypothetical protein
LLNWKCIKDIDRFEVLAEEMRGGFKAVQENFDFIIPKINRMEQDIDEIKTVNELFKTALLDHETRITTLERPRQQLG